MSAAISSVVTLLRSGVALVFLIAETLLSAALSLFSYVVPAFSFHRMGKKCGVKGAWLAWIPGINVYALGALADHQIKVNEGHPAILRFLLPGVQILRLGLPVVSAALILCLNILTLLFAIPALICLLLILVLVTNTPELIMNLISAEALLSGDTLSIITTVLDVSRDVLPFAVVALVLCGGASLILIPPAALLAAVASFASHHLSWLLLILQYLSLYKVYKLFSYKIYPLFFAVTLSLDLLWTNGFRLVYPLILLTLSRREPVYTRFETEGAAFTSPESDDTP